MPKRVPSSQSAQGSRSGVVNNKLSPLASAVKIAIVGLGLAHSTGQAATIEVNSSLDDGTDCTLRDALTSVNNGALESGCANTGAAFGVDDTVNFASVLAGDTINLDGSELNVDAGISVSLDASEIGGVTIDAGGLSRVLEITNANVEIDSLTISGGNEFSGSGIRVQGSSSLSITDSVISNNEDYAISGADASLIRINNSVVTQNESALFMSNVEQIEIINSSITQNEILDPESFGGVLAINVGTFELTNSTVSDNIGSEFGGMLVLSSVTNITNSTISNNASTRYYTDSSGVSVTGETLTVTNSTISGDLNSFANHQLEIGVNNTNIVNSTILGNSGSSILNAPGLINPAISTRFDSYLGLSNSIVAGEFLLGGADCSFASSATVGVENIITVDSCVTGGQQVDPLLLPLADNGCEVTHATPDGQACVMTHALAANSPAIDAGVSAAPATDQIGTPRPQGAAPDLGAFEVSVVAPTGVPEISVPRAHAREGVGFVSVDVFLSESSTEEVSMAFNTVVPPGQNNPATSGVDFIYQMGTIVFPPGITQRTIDITILDDDFVEANEALRFELSDPVNAEIADDGSALQRVFIINDDGDLSDGE